MTNSDLIRDVLEYHFQNHRVNYDLGEIANYTTLLKINVITKQSSGQITLNFQNNALNLVALEIGASMLSKNIPEDIPGIFEYVKDFDKAIKAKYRVADYQSVYKNLLVGIIAHHMTKIDHNSNNYEFLVALLKEESRPELLSEFEEAYFEFLKLSSYSIENIFNSCAKAIAANNDGSRFAYKYLSDLPVSNRDLAVQLYKYGQVNDIVNYPGFAANILCGLYNSGYRESLQMANDLSEQDAIESLKAVRGFSLLAISEIKKVFDLASGIVCDNADIANYLSRVFCVIIENPNTPKDIIEKSVRKILDLLKSANHEIAHAVFHEIRYGIRNHEYEKYVMLHSYLNNTLNSKVLDDFFYNFKDPQYLIDLLVRKYEMNGFRESIDRFHQQILHLWSENPVQVESQILDLFHYKKFGLLAVKIMLSGNGYPIPIDIHKLDNESQAIALESMCRYPHSIDNLTPTILQFRKSKFPSIKKQLQLLLAELIFTTYHQSLYNSIEKEVGAAKEKRFLAPLKKALDAYEEMKQFKAIKELDPMENDKNFIDLYYRLEHESQAKLMNEMRDNPSGLSAMFKSVTVVRGRAWKLDGKDEVLPMGLIKTSMMIDSKAYKNPIAYEQNLENLSDGY
jgi:hypothetical protein